MVVWVRKQDGIDKLEAEQSQVLEDTTIILLEHGVNRSERHFCKVFGRHQFWHFLIESESNEVSWKFFVVSTYKAICGDPYML